MRMDSLYPSERASYGPLPPSSLFAYHLLELMDLGNKDVKRCRERGEIGAAYGSTPGVNTAPGAKKKVYPFPCWCLFVLPS